MNIVYPQGQDIELNQPGPRNQNPTISYWRNKNISVTPKGASNYFIDN